MSAAAGDDNSDSNVRALRRGWTTGACAAAAARAAYQALLGLAVDDPTPVSLPGGRRPSFALARLERGAGFASAAVIKDAGDDPDVTHGALVIATARPAPAGAGVLFCAGEGVGVVTLPGLPLPPGEPAINPAPRAIIRAALGEIAQSPDVQIEIGIEDGERIAQRTMNGRLGIVGGLSILGTTGVVIPYSCAAWIASIHRGVDIARATGLDHIAGSTGSTSENAVRALYGLPEQALIDMGDFVGGMLAYLRRRPIGRVTIAGGIAKMTKLAQGLLDLHSKRGAVDRDWLADRLRDLGASSCAVSRARTANSALHTFQIADVEGVALGDRVASIARAVAVEALDRRNVAIDVVVFDREGRLTGRSA